MSVVRERPWYRQFWVWFVIAIPLIAVIASLQFVRIAYTHQDALVRDDWYEDGKTINQSLARDERARALGVSALINFDDTSGDVLLTLQSRQPLTPDALRLVFTHATRKALDQDLTLTHLQDGEYRGQLVRPLDGSFQVELSGSDWRLTTSQRLPEPAGITLSAP